MLDRLRDKSGTLRFDLVVAVTSLSVFIGVIYFFSGIEFRVVAAVIPAGAIFYLGTELLSSSGKTEFFSQREDWLHISLLILFIPVALAAPSSPWNSAVVYYPGVGAVAGLITIVVLFSAQRTRLLLFEITLLSVLVRGAMFFQFPSIPGVDAVHTHAPTILFTIQEATITSPTYYDAFPVSHLQAASGSILTGTELKDSMYLFVYFPQAMSVLFVYIFVRTLWGKRPALVAAIFLATTSLNVIYGFRRFPVAMTMSLLPLLLFTLARLESRAHVLSITFFSAILLAHNAPPWILIFFLVLIVPLEYVTERNTKTEMFPAKSLLIVGVFIILKLEYIWISEYYYNVSRIFKTFLTIVGIQSMEMLPTQSSQSAEYRYSLLRFSSTHILLSAVFYFLFLQYIKRLFQWFNGFDLNYREVRFINWYLPVAVLWAGVGYTLIFAAPRYTKMFAIFGVLASPLIYDFLDGFRNIGSQKTAIFMVFMLMFSLSFTGIVHPRSNVSEFNRPDKIAATQGELNMIEFAHNLKQNGEVLVPDDIFGYWWLFRNDLQRFRYSSEKEDGYLLNNGEPIKSPNIDHKIYTASQKNKIYLSFH